MANSKPLKNRKSGEKYSNNNKKGNRTRQILSFLLLAGVVIYGIIWGSDGLLSGDGGDAFADDPAPIEEILPVSGDAPSVSNLASAATKKNTVSKPISELVPERDLRPELSFPFSSQIVEHQGFVLSYNSDYRIPNWVLYELTLTETLGNLRRSNDFMPDPQIPNKKSAQLDDYRHSGFDRGHMAPSSDLNFDQSVQSECYYLSNMCPQDHAFNSGIWLDLEHFVHSWGERDSAITVVCGPVMPRSKAEARQMRSIGRNHVLVPDYFFKIVLAPYAKPRPQAIGFVMPNQNETEPGKSYNRRVRRYAVSVDSIEVLTGIDFFPILPDDVEDLVESQISLRYWFNNESLGE